MRFLTRTASKNLRSANGKADWDRRLLDYARHLSSIKSSLTRGWQRIGETDFHDAVVWSVQRPLKSELILRVDMTPRWQQPPLRVCTLHFTGVVDADVPDGVTHDWWLYGEVDRADNNCGELRVLLRESHFRIVSRDVDSTTNFNEAA
jgi:hypothetical protein